MSQIGSLKSYTNRTILIIFAILFGLISSRALVSIGTLLLAFNLIISSKEHKWQFVKIGNFGILSGTIFFLTSLTFVLFSPDISHAFKQVYYRLPWLIIPLSIAAISKPKTINLNLVLAFFVGIISVSGMVVLVNYFSNYEYYTAQIALAKNIPTPLNHIRYSLMVAFAGLTSIYFTVKDKLYIAPNDRIFMGVASFFLFVLIHVLSVRSGLISYYLGLIFLIVYFAFYFRKFWVVPLFGLAIIAMPFIAYQAFPSFQNKVAYMKYDVEQIKAGNIGHNSDGRRWRSLKMAKVLITKKPLMGYGCGQAEKVSKKYYQENFPNVAEQNQKVPHNQFLFSALEMGVFGALAVFLVFFSPLIQKGVLRNPLYITLWIIILSSTLVENTFESQIGMSFFLVMGSLLLKHRKDE